MYVHWCVHTKRTPPPFKHLLAEGERVGPPSLSSSRARPIFQTVECMSALFQAAGQPPAAQWLRSFIRESNCLCCQGYVI